MLGWATLTFASMVLALVLSPGLRGTLSGISKFIDFVAGLSAFLSQASGLLSMPLVVHLEITLLRSRQVSPFIRAISIPLSAVTLTLLMNATVDSLPPGATLAMTGSAALLALTSGSVSIFRGRDLEGRLLILAGLVATTSGLSRLVAWFAQDPLVVVERPYAAGLATLAWALNLALVVFALWPLARSSGRSRLSMRAFLAIALLLAWIAVQSTAASPSWQVLVARSLSTLNRPPLPFVPEAGVHFVNVLALGGAAWALLDRSSSPRLRTVVCLSLLASRAPDLPLMAVALTIAALGAETPWQASTPRAPEKAERSADENC